MTSSSLNFRDDAFVSIILDSVILNRQNDLSITYIIIIIIANIRCSISREGTSITYIIIRDGVISTTYLNILLNAVRGKLVLSSISSYVAN